MKNAGVRWEKRKWLAALVLLSGTLPPALLYLALEHKFRGYSSQIWTAASPICLLLSVKTGIIGAFAAVLILTSTPNGKGRTSLAVCLTVYALDYIVHLCMVGWLLRL